MCITFAEADRRRRFGTAWDFRAGVRVLEVKDVHADFARLVLDGCDDLAAHKLGACTHNKRIQINYRTDKENPITFRTTDLSHS